MTTLNVISFDPGGTTGYCVMGVEKDVLLGALAPTDTLHNRLEYVKTGEIDCGTRHGQTGRGEGRGHAGLNFAGEDAGIDAMIGICSKFPVSRIVIEDFVLDFAKADSARHTLSPVRIIAKFSFALRQECLMGFRRKDYEESIFIQSRSLAKTTCTDERLREWGLYQMGEGGGARHARDAVRHAYYFLRTCRGSGLTAQNNRFLAWPEVFPDPFVAKKRAIGNRPDGGRSGGQIVPGLG